MSKLSKTLKRKQKIKYAPYIAQEIHKTDTNPAPLTVDTEIEQVSLNSPSNALVNIPDKLLEIDIHQLSIKDAIVAIKELQLKAGQYHKQNRKSDSIQCRTRIIELCELLNAKKHKHNAWLNKIYIKQLQNNVLACSASATAFRKGQDNLRAVSYADLAIQLMDKLYARKYTTQWLNTRYAGQLKLKALAYNALASHSKLENNEQFLNYLQLSNATLEKLLTRFSETFNHLTPLYKRQLQRLTFAYVRAIKTAKAQSDNDALLKYHALLTTNLEKAQTHFVEKPIWLNKMITWHTQVLKKDANKNA